MGTMKATGPEGPGARRSWRSKPAAFEALDLGASIEREAAVSLQKVWRGACVRRRLLREAASVMLQSAWRGRVVRRTIGRLPGRCSEPVVLEPPRAAPVTPRSCSSEQQHSAGGGSKPGVGNRAPRRNLHSFSVDGANIAKARLKPSERAASESTGGAAPWAVANENARAAGLGKTIGQTTCKYPWQAAPKEGTAPQPSSSKPVSAMLCELLCEFVVGMQALTTTFDNWRQVVSLQKEMRQASEETGARAERRAVTLRAAAAKAPLAEQAAARKKMPAVAAGQDHPFIPAELLPPPPAAPPPLDPQAWGALYGGEGDELVGSWAPEHSSRILDDDADRSSAAHREVAAAACGGASEEEDEDDEVAPRAAALAPRVSVQAQQQQQRDKVAERQAEELRLEAAADRGRMQKEAEASWEAALLQQLESLKAKESAPAEPAAERRRACKLVAQLPERSQTDSAAAACEREETSLAAKDPPIEIDLRAFGKDGVRVCWKLKGEPPRVAWPIVISYMLPGGGAWQQHSELPSGLDAAGVCTVRSSEVAFPPRSLLWSCARGQAVSEARSFGQQLSPDLRRLPELVHVDVDMAFNVLQLPSLSIYDGRSQEEYSAGRIRGSIFAGAGLPDSGQQTMKRENALLVGEDWSPERLKALGIVAVGKIFQLPELTDLSRRFPFLVSSSGSDPLVGVPKLPNLILPGLFIGDARDQQSVVLWRRKLKVTHVLDMEKTDGEPPMEDGVDYISSKRGLRLEDAAGEQESFNDCVGEFVPAIARILRAPGVVFLCSRHGRSRCCAVAVAFLMIQYGRPLAEALSYVAKRRPCLEINEDYLRCMAAWEATPSCSLRDLLREHPGWVRRSMPRVERSQQISGHDITLLQHTWNTNLPADGRPPRFQQAAAADQLAIGHQSGYGATLLEMMQEFETSQVVQGLYVGHMADAAYMPFLVAAHITHVVCCAREALPPPYQDAGLVQYLCFPWWDSEEQASAIQKNAFADLHRANRFVHEALSEGGVVLVHGFYGVSRAPALVAAYLQEYRGAFPEQAIGLVRRKHPGAFKQFPFQEMLRAFHYHLLGRKTTAAAR
eukprot:TRINITY_DN17924_c0_g1_i2.p1 TRINITY_DN17924_c0_g1~~TRINITY_DN17924_c0_g1_i2.p1  ORF type:complete len:1075 (+),score=235.99 TRINITY_DN17924_c0_g1_i2:208-3432(+)